MPLPTYYGDLRSAGVPTYDVTYFGAKGNGTADDTVAIQAAITAAGVTGGIVFFPGGRYKVTATLNLLHSGISLQGVSWNQNGVGSIISTTFATGDVFNIAVDPGGGLLISNLVVDRQTLLGSAPTGGVTFNVHSATNLHIDSVFTMYSYDDIQVGTSGEGICNQIFVTNYVAYVVGRYGINVVGICGNLNILNCYFGGLTSAYNAGTNCWLAFNFGAHTDGVSPMFINMVDVESFATGIEFTGQGYISDWFINALEVDGAHGHCINFSPSNTNGAISRTKIHNCYLTSNTSGYNAILLSPFRNSSFLVGVDEITISGCNLSTASGAAGLFIGNGTADVVVTGNQIYGCSGNYGIVIGGNSTTHNVVVTGNRIGNVYAAPNLGGVSIAPQLGATVDKVTVVGNDLTGNTNQAIDIDSSVGTVTNILAANNNCVNNGSPTIQFLGTTAASVVVRGNLGYNPVGAMTTPSTPGASPWTYTNTTGVDQIINVSGGTVTIISANGVVTGLTAGSFLVPVGKTLVVTYSAVPTVTASGN